ncbi:MAG: GrpB family protein [Roseivirga sp.]
MLITPYTDSWVEKFQSIRLALDTSLQGIDYTIEHVGSTSIDGLDAKAIIDIDIIYEQATEFEQIKAGLISIGYYHNGDQGIPQREVFKRTGTQHSGVLDNTPHHLYVCLAGSPGLNRHLLFRDHLRKNDEARLTYQAMKYELAARANQDKKRYAELKELHINDFVDSVIEAEKQLNSKTR